jgi:hypothetical protein
MYKVVQEVEYERSNNFTTGIKIKFVDQIEINLRISQSCCEFSAFYNPDFSSLKEDSFLLEKTNILNSRKYLY